MRDGATSRVGFVVIAENAEIFSARCRKADSINSKNDRRRLERAARDVAADQNVVQIKSVIKNKGASNRLAISEGYVGDFLVFSLSYEDM